MIAATEASEFPRFSPAETFDVVLIATNHSSVNYRDLADWAQRIVDTRNAMASVPVAPGKVWRA